jgi:hypothetical protein
MPPSIQSAVTVRVDTLNDLPDEILTHILSFLPYKEAIRTRILSKRWLPLCHSLSVININNEGASSANTKDWTHFRQFMDAIMFSPRSQHVPLKSFHLKFHYKFWDDNVVCSINGSKRQNNVASSISTFSTSLSCLLPFSTAKHSWLWDWWVFV